jgi:tRNA threonylcarbamoyladenosine biosynthesis protein TsaE
VSWRRHTKSAQETQRAGEEFAALLRPGDIVLLSGILGAGKTTFTQGVARGLGVSERVTSPTFTMVRQHECVNELGIATLHHADVYRAGSLSEIDDLALGELVEESAVALVEWGDVAASLFGHDVISVGFTIDDDDGRTLEVGGALDGRTIEVERWTRS